MASVQAAGVAPVVTRKANGAGRLVEEAPKVDVEVSRVEMDSLTARGQPCDLRHHRRGTDLVLVGHQNQQLRLDAFGETDRPVERDAQDEPRADQIAPG